MRTIYLLVQAVYVFGEFFLLLFQVFIHHWPRNLKEPVANALAMRYWPHQRDEHFPNAFVDVHIAIQRIYLIDGKL
jgi:hypothetical protein